MTDENINALPEEHDTGELYYHDHGDGHVHAHTHTHEHGHGHTHTQTKAVVNRLARRAESRRAVRVYRDQRGTLSDAVALENNNSKTVKVLQNLRTDRRAAADHRLNLTAERRMNLLEEDASQVNAHFQQSV